MKLKKNQSIEALARENELYEFGYAKTRFLIIGALGLWRYWRLYCKSLYEDKKSNDKRRLLTLEQSMLRSQMNPHFWFNSLNSISCSIINNERRMQYILNKILQVGCEILEASS